MIRAVSAGGCVIYGGSLAHRGGTGVYLRRLLRGLLELRADRVLVASPQGLVGPAEALALKDWPTGMAKVLFEQMRAPGLARRHGAVAVHLPAFAGRAPIGAAALVTVHDMAHAANPGWFPFPRSLYYRLAFGRIARRADLVLTDSRFTADEAVRMAGVERSRIRVVYLSADNGPAEPEPLMKRLGLEKSYLLYVGTVEPRKNLDALLDALGRVREKRPGTQLLVAGRWGWGPAGLASRLRQEPGVVWDGALSELDLRRAYTGASLLVYPSLYEGFGLPPLEAARVGTPSVIGPAEALREVYAGAAFASDGDAHSLAETVLKALDSPPPSGMAPLARRRTNARMAEEVIGIYREAGA